MSERVILFGPGDGLAGVLGDALGAGALSRTGFVFFNAGFVGRVGPHRLNVKLARALGALGAPTLRFDLSGLGDSAPADPDSGLDYAAQAEADLRCAAATLRADAGVSRIVAVGLCSGADHALRAGASAAFLDGLVLIDPYAYRHPGAAAIDILDRARDPARWRRAIARLAARRSAADGKPGAAAGGIDQGRPVPPKTETAAAFANVAARGAPVLVVYTGLVRAYVSRPAHFFDVFAGTDFRGLVDVVAMPHTDHTFTRLADQGALIATVTDWAAARFGMPAQEARHG